MLELILVCLAVFRLTILITDEDGPRYMFANFRAWSTQHLYPYFDADCSYCVSLWLSLPAALIVASGWWILLYWFAIAGVASFLISTNHRIQDV